MAITLDDIKQAAVEYFAKFDSFASQNGLIDLKPTTIGWKTTDISEFNATLSGYLADSSVTQCHIGFVDQRYIASIVFKEPIYTNVRILKLMQRRPNSTDPVGLDHADFAVDNLGQIEALLKKNPALKWSHESNEVHGWISVWFNDTEAKFVDHLVLDVGVKELQDITKELGFEPKKVA